MPQWPWLSKIETRMNKPANDGGGAKPGARESPDATPATGGGAAVDRAARRAAALRENLRRRKAQSRARDMIAERDERDA